MVIVLKATATEEDREHVCERVVAFGFRPHVIVGEERTIIGAVGVGGNRESLLDLHKIACVDSVVPIQKPYKLASLETKPTPTIVEVGPARFGGGYTSVIAGPCSVETPEQVLEAAVAVKQAGAKALRGGAFKPRTSPYSFQGMGEDGLKWLRAAGDEVGLPIVTEVMNPRDLDLVERYADVLQIGARNIQNFSLLKLVGETRKPVLLKRGMSTTIEEFLMSAEYILSEGNRDVILCERGIRTFETATRNTLDISAIPVLHQRTHLPIIIDPSHATGFASLVPSLSLAAMAAGADGLMIEVHPNPDMALCDGPQSLNPPQFAELMVRLDRLQASLRG
ncbi:3-deoxy-7-phosphoheptulonate synthase [Desulfurispirillum indicum]|uniref:Phospho-2-dehydro-3-deoxyheptonate aldolase n=1 Tax=Desulfurispirillum indicum (strain ATCC BAA-1389 / DSM 22839 / S5) TaxID=653733 RepID=E6W1M2_DESIS|nr:3-deoxy-7-phosphoheptulonate synthase [Desulfurispirillum indicum]ADU66571.1 phospho-2-dehydro-3-deoxyheptonate aldolase [Desulfurispirillum indicum S5]UCZ55892.1 3-deoxy-7-phosphoheptulonate synthase [Desulfurispirillum indicum]